MIVTCSSCETKFEIPDDKYRPGRKARCSNCGNVFVLPEVDDLTASVTPPPFAEPDPAAEPDPGVEGGQSSRGSAIIGEMPHDPKPSGDETAAEEAAQAEPVPPAVPASVDDAVLDPEEEKKKKPKNSLLHNKKNLLFVLGIVLVVALLGYGGAKVYTAFISASPANDPVRLSDDRLSRSLGSRTGEQDQEKEAARLAAVRRLNLENVRQYMVTENKNAGPIVVIEGAVVNNFDTPKSLILLELTMFDEKGNALVLQEQYCGITIPDLQLRNLTKEALQSALNSQTNILINNTDIQPGASVPFMALFFNLPKASYEFEVKIVDVQDSAPLK